MGKEPEEQNKPARPASIGTDSLPQAQRDILDMNNEIAGRDVGRMQRFLPADSSIRIEEKKREDERKFSALVRALQDPEYAKLYDQVRSEIDRAARAAARALDKLTQASELADEKLRSLKDAAAELPDGRKVFRSTRDGRLYAEDGSDVTKDVHLVTGLTDGSPSWEQYSEARESAEDLENRRREVERYQREVVEPSGARLADEDNPPSTDELNDILEDLGRDAPPDVTAEMARLDEQSLSAEHPSTNSAAEDFLGAYDLNAPDVGNQFELAAAPASAVEPATPAPAPIRKPV